MHNCPAFPAVLFSCMRLGAELALINYNHRSTTLIHSLKLTGCKLIIVGEDELLQVLTVEKKIVSSSPVNLASISSSIYGT